MYLDVGIYQHCECETKEEAKHLAPPPLPPPPTP